MNLIEKLLNENKRLSEAESTIDKWVIVNTSDGEMFTGTSREIYGQAAHYTSYKRDNYEQARTYKSKEAAQAYLDSHAELFRGSAEVKTFSDAKDALGDIGARQTKDREEREARRKQNQQWYQSAQKERRLQTKKSNPGRYEVTFFYSNRWLGSESFEVDAESIDDAFNKAKRKALAQDPYRNLSGYDQRMIFNKNNIRKLS